jgi:hypothetical protein
MVKYKDQGPLDLMVGPGGYDTSWAQVGCISDDCLILLLLLLMSGVYCHIVLILSLDSGWSHEYPVRSKRGLWGCKKLETETMHNRYHVTCTITRGGIACSTAASAGALVCDALRGNEWSWCSSTAAASLQQQTRQDSSLPGLLVAFDCFSRCWWCNDTGIKKTGCWQALAAR